MKTWLQQLGLQKLNRGVFCGEWFGSGRAIRSTSPIDGKFLGSVTQAKPEEYENAMQRAQPNCRCCEV